MMIDGVVLATLASIFLASPALAHPHIFIDTEIEVIFDDEGRAEALRIFWSYDDLTSLQVIADRGMDPDFDGHLTDAESAALSGFDMNWELGFAGDTYALLGSAPLELSGPSDWTVRYSDDIITSSHLRRFAVPVRLGEEALTVQTYDPTLYSGYFIANVPKLANAPACSATIQKPDTEAANKLLDAAIASLPGDVENDFPALGAAFAEEVRITCSAPS
jgi:ABC-type uncharacterized transport system substrate-binding protein